MEWLLTKGWHNPYCLAHIIVGLMFEPQLIDGREEGLKCSKCIELKGLKQKEYLEQIGKDFVKRRIRVVSERKK